MRVATTTGRIHPFTTAALLLFTALLAMPAGAEDNPAVGIEYKTGVTIALDQMSFRDESGAVTPFRDVFDKPVVLTLVYFRCPGICAPLLTELTRIARQSDLFPGRDYRFVSISFDPSDGPDLARTRRDNLLAALGSRPIPRDAWRVWTGDEENIRRITTAVGFQYTRDPNQSDFIHGSTVIFLAKSGMITGYLTGLRFNPVDLEMGVTDAAAGRPRTFMQKTGDICYSSEPQRRDVAFGIVRIALGVSLVVIIALVVILIRRPGSAERRVP